MAPLIAVTLALVALLYLRERAHDRERAELLQRIQAPEKAVIEHTPRKLAPVPVVAVDDDEYYARKHGQSG